MLSKLAWITYALLLGVATVLQTSRATAQGFPAGGVPRFEPTSCSAWLTKADLSRCGFLVVPENRKRRTGRTILVAVAFVKSTTHSQGPPLVYLGGGPGGR